MKTGKNFLYVPIKELRNINLIEKNMRAQSIVVPYYFKIGDFLIL